MIKITLGNKSYNVKEAKTEEEKEQGLQDVTKLPEDLGMIFYYDSPQKVSFWMHNTPLPLDIIFINEDLEVIKVYKGEPNDETMVTVPNTMYVVELNLNSCVKKGDELEFDEDEAPVMRVLAQDGSTLMELWGSERIFSRKNTLVLVRKAKKADESKSDSDYKALGRFMFKCIKTQDERSPEYVLAPTLS